MASEYSFDIVSQFDAQELKNAVDQTQREIATRYDLKGTGTEMTLNDDDVTIVGPDMMKLEAVRSILFQKLINRKLSPKMLDIQDAQPSAGGNMRQIMKLLKVLNQDVCKSITKHIKEEFPKVKSSIQGETVRVSAKNKDDLQNVIASLKSKDLGAPLQFTNYR